MLSNQRTPVSKQRCVFYSQVCRVWLPTAFSDDFVPTLELAKNVVLGDAGRPNELSARRGGGPILRRLP
jgi:hypothetical protein